VPLPNSWWIKVISTSRVREREGYPLASLERAKNIMIIGRKSRTGRCTTTLSTIRKAKEKEQGTRKVEYSKVERGEC